MTTTETLKKINNDLDFIAIKRYKYSLKRLMERYPEGCPNRVIAAALMITEEDVAAQYTQVVAKLQALIGVSDE